LEAFEDTRQAIPGRSPPVASTCSPCRSARSAIGGWLRRRSCVFPPGRAHRIRGLCRTVRSRPCRLWWRTQQWRASWRRSL